MRPRTGRERMTQLRHTRLDVIDPDLKRRVADGRYVVDAPRVAEAVLHCATIVAEVTRLGELRIVSRRLSLMLVPAEDDWAAVAAAQDEPGLDKHLA